MGVAALALVASATIASVYTIAVFMIVAGAAEIATGLSAKTWRGFVVWILPDLPISSTRPLRLPSGPVFGASARHPVLLAGVLTALVGVLIVAGWPVNRFVILGVLFALDLAFWGAAWIGFGLRLRRY